MLSEEGTTQGDPLPTPFYALATIPLLQLLLLGVKQIWYADDACGELSDWWDNLCKLGPSFGYYVNATKTWLVFKGHLKQDAVLSFNGSYQQQKS